MSEQNMNPDDGVEDEFIGWMNAVRAGRDRWRGRGVNQRRRRTKATKRARGPRSSQQRSALRQETTARLIAALEAKHHALDIERERANQQSAGQVPEARARSAEDIRRQALAPETNDAPALRSSDVAQKHVEAQREQLITLGVSAATVDGMIGQYEQQLNQARHDARTTEVSANTAEVEANRRPHLESVGTPPAMITEDGRHLAGGIDLTQVQAFTADSLNQIEELESGGTDPTTGELLADSGIESGMPVNTTSADTAPDMSAIEAAVLKFDREQEQDRGVQA